MPAKASAQVAGDSGVDDGDGKDAVTQGAGDGGKADFEKMIAERDDTIAGL